jgi:microcystin-dependent protein
MADPFVGEILLVGFNFAPNGYALCNGQLLPISQNTTLFSILGTTYGGDGKSTFALPDLQGALVQGAGLGPGLSEVFLGQLSGRSEVALLQSEMPAHTHDVQATTLPGNLNGPSSSASLARSKGGVGYTGAGTGPQVGMSLDAVQPAGSSQPHNNQMPSLGLNYVIALQGVFPSRW